ncbi:unnamed protein product [Brassicogethes aeneus]|uniref:Ran-specific GTPase-activating protein n=1 Tax=Brassicogethes aeneus TaxID=1431903 RepID=A0A9P0AWN8_BRAAE|nr:unnamed protein product [Brassicogethes aeneus]
MSESEAPITLTNDHDKSLTENGEETEFDPQFKPIVTLPEVEVKLNEDDEEEMLKIRAKLYRFDSNSDPSEWKERGTGELKMLRHKENNSVRIVMRRDKTFKICANHFLTPWMELKKNPSTDRAYVYTVPADFADEKAKSECLAIKFGNVENAILFKTRFEDAKKILATDCDLYNGKCDENGSSSEDDEDEAEVSDKENKESNEITQKMSELEVKKDEDEKIKN